MVKDLLEKIKESVEELSSQADEEEVAEILELLSKFDDLVELLDEHEDLEPEEFYDSCGELISEQLEYDEEDDD